MLSAKMFPARMMSTMGKLSSLDKMPLAGAWVLATTGIVIMGVAIVIGVVTLPEIFFSRVY